jgi:hypothetical protein
MIDNLFYRGDCIGLELKRGPMLDGMGALLCHVFVKCYPQDRPNSS